MEPLDIKVNFTTAKERITNHLSVIGKRAVDGKGNTLWSKITMQSAEMGVIEDYLLSSVHKIVNTLKDIYPSLEITQEVYDDIAHIYLDDDRLNEGFSDTFEGMCNRFAVSYALAEYLQMTGTDFGKKYETEELSILSDIKGLFMFKSKPGMSTAEYSSVTGSKEDLKKK